MRNALLDTDTTSEFFRGKPKVIAKAISYLREVEFLSISIITYYEILHGLFYKDAKKQLTGFLTFAEKAEILTLTTRSARLSAEIFADLRMSGKPIGHTDCLIAGIAIANDCRLVTNNVAHFTRIKGLEIENWME